MKRRILGSFPGRVAGRYLDAKGGNWATIIAWNGFFAFFPIILVTITVVGLLLQNDSVRGSVEHQVASAFPECRQDGPHCAVLQALNDFKQRPGITGLLGFAGLLWSGSSLFGAMEQGLNSLYRCKPRGFLRQKLMAFAMILLFTVLAVPLLMSSSILSIVQSLPDAPQAIHSPAVSVLLQVAAGVLDATLLFLAIYVVVPNRRTTIRRALPGALTAGVLVELFTLVFPLYFRLGGGFASYGQAFALVFVILFYFYVLGLIVVVGAAVNAEAEERAAACASGPGERAGGLTGRRRAPGPVSTGR